MADHFAALMESENKVRKEMASRVQAKAGASPAVVAERVAPKKPVDVDAELRRLGLGPAKGVPAKAAPPRPPAVASPASLLPTTKAEPAAAAAAPLVPAAKPKAGLDALLAARKAQVSRAVNTELLGLRTEDWDSDDARAISAVVPRRA